MGKGVWFVFVSPRRIPCNAQGNKPETPLAPEGEKPHKLDPHPLYPLGTVQCWALWQRVVECTNDSAIISFVQVIPFKDHKYRNLSLCAPLFRKVWSLHLFLCFGGEEITAFFPGAISFRAKRHLCTLNAQVPLINHYQFSVFEKLWMLLCLLWSTGYHERPVRLSPTGQGLFCFWFY